MDVLKIDVLAPWLLGMIFGVFVGSTPGLTATMAVALIVPMAWYMTPDAGLAMIIGVSFTAIFAGDIPATFLRIPGTPASAAATLDGHELARKGQGTFALRIDLICSCLGGIIGVGLLMAVAPQLAKFALLFSHCEYFWLAVLGLCLSALVSRGSMAKGLLSAALGLLLSTVGMDGVSGTPRYTFSGSLLEGLHFIPVMIGLFGLAEVFRNVRDWRDLSTPSVTAETNVSWRELFRTIWQRKFMVLQSASLGSLIGALPGAGADVAAWGAYGVARKTSAEGDEFGTGTTDGVIAPTSANNAAVAGAWIPAIVFGVPGDAVTAIVLGAFRVYDIQTGPAFFTAANEAGRNLFTIALVTQLLLIPAGLFGIHAFRSIMRLPRAMVLVSVIAFSVVGAFAFRNSGFDVCVMVVFGLVGFFLEARGVPLAPMILGLILGEMVETRLRLGLISSDGNLTPFFTRPICMVMVFVLLAIVVWPIVTSWRRRKRRGLDR